MVRKLNNEIITQHPIYIVLYLFKLIVQTFIQKSTFMREYVPTCTKYMPDIQKERKSKVTGTCTVEYTCTGNISS
jgi:hypothetical protein